MRIRWAGVVVFFAITVAESPAPERTNFKLTTRWPHEGPTTVSFGIADEDITSLHQRDSYQTATTQKAQHGQGIRAFVAADDVADAAGIPREETTAAFAETTTNQNGKQHGQSGQAASADGVTLAAGVYGKTTAAVQAGVTPAEIVAFHPKVVSRGESAAALGSDWVAGAFGVHRAASNSLALPRQRVYDPEQVAGHGSLGFQTPVEQQEAVAALAGATVQETAEFHKSNTDQLIVGPRVNAIRRETHMTSPPFDCNAGLETWEMDWSLAKVKWCCQHDGKVCGGAGRLKLADSRCFEDAASWEPLDMQGHSMSVENDATACQHRCSSVPGCMHFSFFKGAQSCHLQDAFAIRKANNPGFVSGPTSCGAKLLDQGDFVYFGHGTFLPRDLHCLQFGVVYVPDFGEPAIFSPRQDMDNGIMGMNTIKSCQQHCDATEGCRHFSVQFPAGFCRLAGPSARPLANMAGFVSGPRFGCDTANVKTSDLLARVLMKDTLGMHLSYQAVGTGSAALVVLLLLSATIAAAVRMQRRVYELLQGDSDYQDQIDESSKNILA